MIVSQPIQFFLFINAAPIIARNTPISMLFILSHTDEKIDKSDIINQVPNAIFVPSKIILNLLFIGFNRKSIYLPVQKMLIHTIFKQIASDKLEKCLLFNHKYVANMKLFLREVSQ
jgi:hypothetical protein